MTKEELKQEAEEWLCNNLHSASEEDFIKAMVDIAEPREKRIAELEHQLTHRNCLDCSNHSSKLRMRTLELEKENAELKKINADGLSELNHINGDLIIENEKLKKENAELKHTIATLRQEKDNVSMHAKAMEVVAKTRSDQLTKAKGYIKLLLMNCVGVYESTGKTIAEIQTEAEQFLSEVEK